MLIAFAYIPLSGVGYTPYGDHFANHCGMEVVLPTGEVVRLGMGALPGPEDSDNPCWQSFQYGYGPYHDGIFSQSNYGIVTKMGFWLMPATEHQSFLITFPHDDDLEAIMDTIQPLSISRVLGNVPQLRHAVQELAVTGRPRLEFYQGSGPIPREVVREHMKQSVLGDVAWTFYGTVYGSADARAASLKIIRDAFTARIPGNKFYLPEDLPSNHYLHSRVDVCSGKPVLKELDWLNWKPNGSHLFFAPIAPTASKHVRRLYSLVEKRVHEFGLDFIPTLCVAFREVHIIVVMIYNRGDEDEKLRATKCLRAMIDDAAKEGYGEYRTHILFADQVAQTYGWNDGALMKLNERIKDSLDPNGILAPGRNGIWPARFRGKGWEILSGDERIWSVPSPVYAK